MLSYHFVSLLIFGLSLSVIGENAGYVEKIGNPEDTNIERPCPTYDLNCIRAFFEKHGHCKKTFGPVPDPISRPKDNIYLPRINLTISIVAQRVSGLNGRVEEFYINRKTDRLVIAVEFSRLTQTSDKVFYITHRRAREPVVTTSAYASLFAPITITAVIPKIDDLQLHVAECTSFMSAPSAPFGVTPDIIASTDPQPAMSISGAFTNFPVDMEEIFLTDSAYFIATYIQFNICDFGLFLT